jgi:hypothetical protein
MTNTISDQVREMVEEAAGMLKIPVPPVDAKNLKMLHDRLMNVLSVNGGRGVELIDDIENHLLDNYPYFCIGSTDNKHQIAGETIRKAEDTDLELTVEFDCVHCGRGGSAIIPDNIARW